MKVNLLGGNYRHKYKAWNSQECINWYPVYQTAVEKNKSSIALFPTPGLTEFCDLTGTSIRGLIVVDTINVYRAFAVCGKTLYEIGKDASFTSMGTLSSFLDGTDSKVSMEVNNSNQLYIADSAAGYVFNLLTDTLTEITDAQYVAGNTSGYLDGYIFTVANDASGSSNEGRIWFSDISDASAWSGNVIDPSFASDKAQAIGIVNDNLAFINTNSTTVYRNDGTNPFSEISGSTTQIGTRAPNSVVSFKEGVVWLGGSRLGEVAVYFLSRDYTIQQISPPSITWQLNNKINTSDAEGFIQHTKDGHLFYYLTVPALETTYVYNFITKEWHQRKSRRGFPTQQGENLQYRFRGRNYINFHGMNLFGDWYSGKIFKEDYDVYTEDSQIITRVFSSPVYTEEKRQMLINSIELDCHSGEGATTGQGVEPILEFRKSTDGGRTYNNPRIVYLNRLGQRENRVRLTQLGSARDWHVSFTLTDPIDLAVFDVYVHGIVGAI
jgi:hypothetical protein